MRDIDYFELETDKEIESVYTCNTCGSKDHLTHECPEDVIFNNI